MLNTIISTIISIIITSISIISTSISIMITSLCSSKILVSRFVKSSSFFSFLFLLGGVRRLGNVKNYIQQRLRTICEIGSSNIMPPPLSCSGV